MPSYIHNPRATASLAFHGLSVFCYNQRFNDGEGRWEIAVPHFPKHLLSISLPSGTLVVADSIKAIAIKARTGVRPTQAKYQPGYFNRQDVVNSDAHDFRWLTDFTDNSEIPHGEVSIIKKGDPDATNRVEVTMIYVYRAVGYTKERVPDRLVLAPQRDTCPIGSDGEPIPLPNDEAARVLDAIPDSAAYGYSADLLGLDIEGIAGGEAVDIMFDNGFTVPIEKGSQPRELKIENVEPSYLPIDNTAIVGSNNYEHGRGDFFRYYQVLRAAGNHYHMWARRHSVGPKAARTGDCNGIGVNFDDLGDMS